MSIVTTVKETERYSYDIDSSYGTGWFVRKSDDMVSLMDTGQDMLDRKAAYPMLADESFDLIASNQTYTGRWSEDS